MRRSKEEGRKIMGFYVYKFISRESEVLYVGRTTDIEVRVRDHSIEKEFYNEVFKIKYAEFDSPTDMKITELILINTLSPKHNIKDVTNSTIYRVTELEWKDYDPEKEKIRKVKKRNKPKIRELRMKDDGSFKFKLKNARYNKGISQSDIADKINVTSQYYNLIENGHRRPSPERAQKIAEILSLDWSGFFDDEESI